MTESHEKLRAFLIEEAHWDGSREELTDELPLIENGVLDSMALLRLVAWLQSTYGIEIGDAEVVPGNFDSIALIAAFIEAKQRPAPGA
jgi:acyl carrier protein